MSDVDRTKISYIEETTYGKIPSGPPTLIDVPFTSESLSQQTSIVKSAELRNDRQVTNINRTNREVSGELNFEFSAKNYDEFLEALLMNSWSTQSSFSTGTIIGNSAEDSITGGSWVTNGVLVNDWIYVIATGQISGLYKIVSVTESKIFVSHNGVPDQVAINTNTVILSSIKNKTSLKSYVFEKDYNDISKFAVLNGMSVESLSLSVSNEDLVSGSFSFIGKSETSGTATVGDGSNIVVQDTDIINSTDNVIAIIENKSIYATVNFSFSISNNLRTRLRIADLGPVSIGTGKVNISGTISAYFTNVSVMNKYLNLTSSSLVLQTKDKDENRYVFEFPQIKFTDGKRIAGGENTDIIADMTFEGYRNSGEDISVKISRYLS